jgi:hypothetical protein
MHSVPFEIIHKQDHSGSSYTCLWKLVKFDVRVPNSAGHLQHVLMKERLRGMPRPTLGP